MRKTVMLLHWIKRRYRHIVLLTLALALGPYVFSRVASPGRRVSIHALTLTRDAPENDLRQEDLRVVSYNIAHGRGLATSNWEGGDREERKAHLDQIAKLLRETNADVVVLNEVDFDSSWSHTVNQARYLAEEAEYPFWAEERNLDFRVLAWKWRFGNAVLSKYPIIKAKVVDLPGYSTWETLLAGKKRGLDCEIDTGKIDTGTHTFRIIGTHLSHRSESVRIESAKVLAELAAASSLPTIIAGDLNSTPPGFPQSVTDERNNNAISVFDASTHFKRLPIDPPTMGRMTYHTTKPKSVIDWILIPRGWSFLAYDVESRALSDHRLIRADVRFAAGSVK